MFLFHDAKPLPLAELFLPKKSWINIDVSKQEQKAFQERILILFYIYYG